MGEHLIGAEGVNRQVLLLYGWLPSAVIDFILTENTAKIPAWRRAWHFALSLHNSACISVDSLAAQRELLDSHFVPL